MKKYIYNLNTFEFIREVEAIEIPDQVGQYIEIPFSTEIAIPDAIPTGSVAVYDEINNQWNIVIDYRNETWYDKTTGDVLQISLGDTKDSLNATELPKPDVFYVWSVDNWVIDENLQKEFLLKQLISAVQMHLDSAAQAKGYDDIKSAALRSAFTGPFQAEGLVFAQWMDSCWETCYTIKAEVENATRTIPTESELIALLPVLTLP